ncbi:MAG: GNAT family N-acetyltransferase [Bacteroidales bacterium]|nr:GNAT family N-acetyltransferase [Bacteroidales bacterium]
MDIKQATPYFLVDALFVLKECIADMNSRGFKQWNNANPGPKVIEKDIDKGTLYLGFELGMVRGMINLTEEMPKEYADIDWKGNGEKVLYVNRLAIHPLYSQTDVTEKLLAFAEGYARENKFTSIRLDVLEQYPVEDTFFINRKFENAGNFHSDFQKLPYLCFEKNI